MPEIQLTKVDARLSRLVSQAVRSPFYARLWSSVDIRQVVDARSFVENVPILRKQDVVAAQQADPPFGGMLNVPASELRQVNVTGGTSGLGAESYGLTAADAAALGEAYAQGLIAIGVPAGARVALTFPLSLSGAPQWIYQGLVAAGYFVLPIGSYSTEQKIQMMRSFGAEVLIGTPSYVEYLAQQIRAQGLDPRTDLGVSRILVATESFSVERGRKIEETYGAQLFEWYGCTQRGIAFTCSEGAITNGRHGVLHFDHRTVFVEVLDPESGQPLFDPTTRDLPAGMDEVEGELVLTFLSAEATPVIRFGTRDRVRAVSSRRCGCGRPGFGLVSGTIGRLDDQLKVRGVNVDTGAVDGRVLGDPDVQDYRVRIFRDEEGRERILAIFDLVESSDPDATLDRCAALLRRALNLSVDVERATVALEPFADTRRKARRWVDDRDRKDIQ